MRVLMKSDHECSQTSDSHNDFVTCLCSISLIDCLSFSFLWSFNNTHFNRNAFYFCFRCRCCSFFLLDHPKILRALHFIHSLTFVVFSVHSIFGGNFSNRTYYIPKRILRLDSVFLWSFSLLIFAFSSLHP